MLTQLSTAKSRLQILDTDTTFDTLLTSAIKALSTRFDKETNRALARTENATFEFDPTDTDLCPPNYPIESVTRFQTKTSEADGWSEVTAPQYIIRHSCIISILAFSVQPLAFPFSLQPLAFRLSYTGGYVLPGDTPGPGQTPLPDDIEQAAVEQIAFWFQHRDKLGLKISWPSGGEYKQVLAQDLLPSVQATLAQYRRVTL